MIDLLGGVPREQKMFKGHLPRVIYHQVYYYTKIGGREGWWGRLAAVRVGPEIRGVRDQMCSTYGPEVNCVMQVDF